MLVQQAGVYQTLVSGSTWYEGVVDTFV